MTRGQTTDDGAQRTAKEAWGKGLGAGGRIRISEWGMRNGEEIENRWVIGDQG